MRADKAAVKLGSEPAEGRPEPEEPIVRTDHVANHRRAAAVLLCLVASGAIAAPDPTRPEGLQRAPVEELKAAYRECNRGALAGRLSQGAVMVCSEVYEALKHKGFGGDFSRLLTWSRKQGLVTEPSAPAGAGLP